MNKPAWTKAVAVISSLALIVTGLVAFFLPELIALLLDEPESGNLAIHLYGAALLGFGFANWHIRHSTIGGIYGRAIVTANIIHSLSASGILLGLVIGDQFHVGRTALLVIYSLLGLGSVLLLFKGGLKGVESEQ